MLFVGSDVKHVDVVNAVSEGVSAAGLSTSVAIDAFDSPETVNSITSSDVVLFVGEIGQSKYKKLERVLALCNLYKKQIVGTVTDGAFEYNGVVISQSDMLSGWKKPLEKVFPTKAVKDTTPVNTPYLPTDSEDIINDDLNYAFDGGLDGRNVIERFLNEAPNHLNDNGIIQMIQSSLSDTEKTLDKLDQLGFIAEVAKSERFFFEEIVLINAYKI